MSEPIDEAFLPVSAFVETSANIEGRVHDPALGTALTVEAATINMPVELDLVVGAGGEVTLGASPPLYYVETTVLPVFHQITLVLEPLQDTPHGH